MTPCMGAVERLALLFAFPENIFRESRWER